MTVLRLLVIGVVGMTCTTSLSAQDLAETAKRAQEQRRAAGGKSIHIEIESADDIRTLPLDRPEVETYVSVRVGLARLWHLDPPLFQRVRGGSLMARSITEWNRAFETEPAVMKVLNRFKYTPEALLAMTKSIAEVERLRGGGSGMNITPLQRQNLEFAGLNEIWLGQMRMRIERAEAGLSIWR